MFHRILAPEDKVAATAKTPAATPHLIAVIDDLPALTLDTEGVCEHNKMPHQTASYFPLSCPAGVVMCPLCGSGLKRQGDFNVLVFSDE